MSLARTLFYVLQVILGSAALRTGHVWPDDICGSDGNQLHIDNASDWLSPIDDTVLPVTTFIHRTVTSSELTGTKEATQEFTFSGHGGPGPNMSLERTLFYVLQVILGSAALRTGHVWPDDICGSDVNQLHIDNASDWLSSFDDTVLPSTTFIHRTVTSSELTGTKEATQEFTFSGHGGPGPNMSLERTLFYVLQVILGSAALRTGHVWPDDICGSDVNQLHIDNASDWLSSFDDTVLPATTFIHRTVTSSELTGTKEATQEFTFSGHGGPGPNMSLERTLFYVLQVILGSAALRTGHVWPDDICGSDGNQLHIDNASDWLSSFDDTVLPATTFVHRTVTSSELTGTKEATQEFTFSGHGGPGPNMSLERTLFYVLQVILGSAALRTGHVWPDDICGSDVNQLHIDNASDWLSSFDDTVLPATTFIHRTVTSSELTGTKEATQEFAFSGHGGPGPNMSLERTLFYVLQVILGSCALRTGHVWPDDICGSDGNQLHIDKASGWLSSLDDTVLPATTFIHRTVTSSELTSTKEATQEFTFSGHGRPGPNMSLERTLLYVLQVILGSAALRTGHVWPDDICGSDGNQLHIDNASDWLSSFGDTVLPATTFIHRTVTSSELTSIKEATQEFTFSGHGGPGPNMSLTRTLFYVLQVILGSAALRTGHVWPDDICGSDGNQLHIDNASDWLSSFDDTVLPATTFIIIIKTFISTEMKLLFGPPGTQA
ncbi:hypothetical protein V5799_006649 [Amblyomma americanum]|uniref:Secreted protein n=1 Tax=Amblyomma americanum TaxID=6943 RepID=A0AAQ4DVS9_AMBAM